MMLKYCVAFVLGIINLACVSGVNSAMETVPSAFDSPVYDISTDNLEDFVKHKHATIVAFFTSEDHPLFSKVLPVLHQVAANLNATGIDSVAVGAMNIVSNMESAREVGATGPVSIRMFSNQVNYPLSFVLYDQYEHGPREVTHGYITHTVTKFLNTISGIEELDDLAYSFGEAIVENSKAKGSDILDEAVSFTKHVGANKELRCADYYTSIMIATLDHGVGYISRMSNTISNELQRQRQRLSPGMEMSHKESVQQMEHMAVLLRNKNILEKFTKALFDEDEQSNDERCGDLKFPERPNLRVFQELQLKSNNAQSSKRTAALE